MDEMKMILNAVLKNQEMTNAKLEALSMDVYKVQGDITGMKGDIVEMKGDIVEMKGDIVEMKGDIAKLDEKLEAFRSETKNNFRKLGRQMDAVELDLDKTIERVERLEIHSSN